MLFVRSGGRNSGEKLSLSVPMAFVHFTVIVIRFISLTIPSLSSNIPLKYDHSYTSKNQPLYPFWQLSV